MSPKTSAVQTVLENENRDESKTMKTKVFKLPDKIFEVRNSLLTDLFENPHIKTVHHLFAALLIGLFVNTAAHNYIEKGEIILGLRLIHKSFSKFHIAIIIWCCTFATTCLMYACFNIWSRVRTHFEPKSRNLKIWDISALTAVLCYYIFSFRISSQLTIYFALPPASSAVVIMETLRLLMKTHAFIRENSPKVLTYKTHSDQVLTLPSFSKFLYFLFAPTLIYRDEYPRTSTIRWKFVAERALEVVGVIFYYSFIFERYLIPLFQEFGIRKFTWLEIFLCICESSLIGILLLLCTFFLFLHAWQNLFAEILRFGDRMFYKDWWRVTSFNQYFRMWNVLVGDFLYTYIYKDMYEIILPNSKNMAKMAVFIVSAIVHEWVLTYMFGFFFPALFIQFFFFGSLLSFINAPRINILNILFWYGLAFGAGSLVSLYTMEYFARLNSPIENPTLKDFFIPRSLTCDCIE